MTDDDFTACFGQDVPWLSEGFDGGSRPCGPDFPAGLYFPFSSKQDCSVWRSPEHDLAAAEESLADTGKPLRERLIGAFDRWAGRYVGPMSRDVPVVIEENPDLLGSIALTAPKRFEERVVAAVGGDAAAGVAQTLISALVGLKHQVETREAYLRRMATAVGLLVP